MPVGSCATPAATGHGVPVIGLNGAKQLYPADLYIVVPLFPVTNLTTPLASANPKVPGVVKVPVAPVGLR